ncbi:hypothetical protein [Nannocystis bainbridge]|uniref:SbsA Ig-like domain-containing protein n=1 Tax=Nannocystis bainbridge TaxID=2995303 RepID=A0ABT5DQT3_9BACT|nr:hypothetical protein [Nannocystis bainbridge]MDC0715404.1 hypothetical protein [Nannocystis bainbridge]
MRLRLLLPLAFVPSCIDFVLDADLDGPRIVATDLPGPRALEVPVAGPWQLEFSEPLDPHRLRLALLAWETVGACELTPECDEGSCERGRCQTDPIATADLRAVERGEPLDDAIPITVDLEDLPSRPGTTLRITPDRPLAPHARHSLLVFARDRRGAPLVDDDGEAAVWRRDLVTAGPASSGPAPRLVSPPPGADLVPTDLARVDIAFARPVDARASDTLELRSPDPPRELRDPVPCPGWVPGLCLSFRTSEPLAPGVVYELGGGSLRDRAGRLLVPPREFAAFRTGPGPDLSPPDLASLAFVQIGRCLHARLHAREPLRLRLVVGPEARELVAPAGPVDLGLRLDAPAGARVTATLQAWDLAGRTAERSEEHVLGDSFDRGAPPLALAEVLANPRGREPAQEFVELADLRTTGDPLLVSGLRLVDGPAGAVELDGGDPLPPFTSAPGQRHLIVPAAYDPDQGDDPGPPPGTSLLRVDASLAAGGLKNSPGEALLLVFEAGAKGPVALDSYGGWHDPGDLPGRSLARDPGGCDTPAAWAPHPSGRANPGLGP